MVGDRPLGDEGDAIQRRQHAVGRALLEGIERGHQPVEAATGQGVVQVVVLAGIRDCAQLARGLRAVECVDDFAALQHRARATVQVGDVDAVGAQDAQRLLDAAGDARPGPVLDAVHAVAEFGRDHRHVTARAQVPADALLRQAVAGRGVDQRDAGVKGAGQQGVRIGFGKPVVAKLPRAQSKRGNPQSVVAVSARFDHACNDTRAWPMLDSRQAKTRQ